MLFLLFSTHRGKVIHLFEERGVEEAPALGQNTSNLKQITLRWKAERTKCFFKQYSGQLEIKVRNKIGLYVFPFSLCHFIKYSNFQKCLSNKSEIKLWRNQWIFTYFSKMLLTG